MTDTKFVISVYIENTAHHPSVIGVAVNVGCRSHRRGYIMVGDISRLPIKKAAGCGIILFII